MLSNNALCLRTAAQYVLLFLALAVNSDQFGIVRSYTLFLQPSVLMHCWGSEWDVGLEVVRTRGGGSSRICGMYM